MIRLVRPGQRLVRPAVDLDAPGRRVVPGLPEELLQPAELALEAGQGHGLRVHGDGKCDLELLPVKHDAGGGLGGVLEAVLEALLVLGRGRRDGEADRVLLRVVAEAAPGGGDGAEGDGPGLRGGDGVEAVGSGRELLAAHGDRGGEGDGGVLVCPGAPRLVVGNQRAPDLPLPHRRSVVVDGDVGEAHPLADGGVWTRVGERQAWGLGERRRCAEQDEEEQPVKGGGEVHARSPWSAALEQRAARHHPAAAGGPGPAAQRGWERHGASPGGRRERGATGWRSARRRSPGAP